MQRIFSGMILLLLAFGTANAALLSRSGGQAYYDNVLNITWLANANLADTNDFGVTGINANGSMTWAKANEWIGAMNTANWLGANDWRLPNIIDTGTSGCNYGYTGTDCGYNVNLSTGEMARMFYSTLGNTGYYNTSGNPTGCAGGPNYCLTNTGPFSNLRPYGYWSGTTYAPDPGGAWLFLFKDGYQLDYDKAGALYAWAVRPGRYRRGAGAWGRVAVQWCAGAVGHAAAAGDDGTSVIRYLGRLNRLFYIATVFTVIIF